MHTTDCDHTSQSVREQQLRVIADRLAALTKRFEEFIARHSKRLSTLADAPLSGHYARESWEQERSEFVAQIQQERELLAQAWGRLEVERRQQMLCQQVDVTVKNERDLGGVSNRQFTSVTVPDNVEAREQSDVSIIKQFHQIRQEIIHHSQRVL